MALSLLQDAQTRGLAAALAGIKQEEVDRAHSMSPPMSHNTANMYPGLHPATASALGMLSPQFLAANRSAAAAFMAAQLPMQTLASTLFPHHPALFSSWAQAQHTLSPNVGPHSPPASPISPIMNTKKINNNNLHTNNNNNNNNNNNVSNIDMPMKKARKISVKKDLISPPIEISMSVNDLYSSPGPISPPSSGSSPNSNQDGPVNASKDPSRDKSFTCKICSRSFGYKHVLQNHERTHTGEKPFECPECHKRFTRDHHLKTHMRLHTGEKPYHCSHCDRQFVQVANLRRHLRVHTGERPYTCEICENRFSDSNQLKSHMLIHNGEKPFECDRCHLKFRRRHHLMSHKCGIQSPPTPAISPAMSDYVTCDQKSAISSFGSDESMDLNKSNLTSSYETPLDLSEDGALSTSGGSIDGDNRYRKSHDVRRIFRLPHQITHIPIDLPVQTEPEDLSMHSPRSNHGSIQSPLSFHHDDDLDDLDDAAALNLKQRQFKIENDHLMTPKKRTIHSME